MLKNTLLNATVLLFVFLILFTGSTNAIILKHESYRTIKNQQNLEKINQINTTFRSGKYNLYAEIYHPLDDTRTYPCIVFCEGFPAYVSAYNWIPKALAEKGYVVIIYDPPGLGQSEGDFPFIFNITFPKLNLYFRFGSFLSQWPHYIKQDYTKAASDALTYILNNSNVKDIVDETSIGIIGHSFGGIVATQVILKDERFDTVIALSHGNSFITNKLNKPILFICGGFDFGVKSIPNTLLSYARSNPSKELIMIQLGTHLGFTTVFNKLCPCPSWQKDIIIRYIVGWFDYFLKNKTSGYEVITTGTNHLSKIFESKYDFGDGEHIISN